MFFRVFCFLAGFSLLNIFCLDFFLCVFALFWGRTHRFSLSHVASSSVAPKQLRINGTAVKFEARCRSSLQSPKNDGKTKVFGRSSPKTPGFEVAQSICFHRFLGGSSQPFAGAKVNSLSWMFCGVVGVTCG